MKTNPLDPTLRDLNQCGCCAGTEAETPAAIENRPGLPSIAFSAGTHAQFKASLLAALSDKERAQLGKLGTREDDDFTIALLDGFAAMADVLTFYSERIANEGFLRTATERRSVLELARAIGYELNPGVAASAWLAFTIEDAPGAPGFANIPKGTKIQSVPGPDEKPQIYETSTELTGRAVWNGLKPKQRESRLPTHNDLIWLKGTATNLKVGDALLFVGPKRLSSPDATDWELRTVSAVRVVPNLENALAHTEVTLDTPLSRTSDIPLPYIFALRQRANLFGHNAPDWNTLPDTIKVAYSGLPIGDVGIRVGQTDPTNTDWQDFEKSGVTLKVDTSSANFSTTPIYLVALHGNTKQWDAIGQDAIYEASATGFRIYLHNITFNNPSNPDSDINAAFAKDGQWHVKWVAIARPSVSAADWPAGVFTNRLASAGKVELDASYPSLTPVTWLVLSKPGSGGPVMELFSVEEAVLNSRAEFGLSSKTTILKLQGSVTKLGAFGLRETTVLAQSELLEWAEFPVTESVTGNTIELDRRVYDLSPDRPLIMLGRIASSSSGAGDERVEVARLLRLVHSADRSRLILKSALQHDYDPASLTIFANVALATHGETVEEIVGHGDASRAHQQFTLKQTTREFPLTFIPSATPTGSETSLEVFVNDVKWEWADSLYDRGRRERVFVARREDDGKTRLIFGDGQSGALLPTGRENIRARYRKGIGLEGVVKAGQLTLLMNRPLGVKAVTNPDASGGAQDPERLDDARRNASLQTLTLGRVVSLQDYEDFARTFGGIAKALATWVWTPRGRGVFVTVALPGGADPPPTSMTLDDLRKALHDFGNPLVPLKVVLGSVRQFVLRGEVTVQPDRIPEKVKAAVDAALRGQFKFDARQLGQNLALSEVIALIQNVPGVESLTLTQLKIVGQSGQELPKDAMLVAGRPQPGAAMDSTQSDPAVVLVLAEDSLADLKVKTP